MIVNDFVKTFGPVTAVDHLSFRMDSPGVFGLIGTNGAGKTTTIRMMLGLLEADSGIATWNGKRITRESLSFGYMPEERGIYMKTKVREQLEYCAVLRGMKKADARISATHFAASDGYGYNDRGRELIDEVYAEVFGTEAAVVRHSIANGTHALTIGLFGLLRPNDIMFSIAGKPYDTLDEVIGNTGKAGDGSLRDFGVEYMQSDLKDDGSFDLERIEAVLKEHKDRIKVVFI